MLDKPGRPRIHVEPIGNGEGEVVEPVAPRIEAGIVGSQVLDDWPGLRIAHRDGVAVHVEPTNVVSKE